MLAIVCETIANWAGLSRPSIPAEAKQFMPHLVDAGPVAEIEQSPGEIKAALKGWSHGTRG